MHAQSLTHSCLILCNPMDCSPPGSSAHGNFPDNTWVGSPFLLPGIFLTQGLNPHLLCLLHWQADSLPLCRQGSLGKHAKWFQSSLTLCSPMDCSPPGSSVHGILQASIWSGLPCPSPGDLPDPGIEPISLMPPMLAGVFFTTSATWEDQGQPIDNQ